MRVIIAEDEYYFRKYLEKAVLEFSPGICIAASAEEGETALAALERGPCDLLITDIRIPGRSGLELAEAAHRAKPPVPVLILSGYAEFDYARTALRYDVEDYLLKPLDVAQLYNAMERIIKSRGLSLEAGLSFNSPDELVQDACSYLDEHFDEEISLDDLAANRYFMNPSYLSRLFKRVTGKNFKRYLIDLRLERARALIEAGMNVTDAATRTGFNNDSYFTRVFKERYSMLPIALKAKAVRTDTDGTRDETGGACDFSR